MIETVQPAGIMDLAEAFAPTGCVHPFIWNMARHQWRFGAGTMALRDGDGRTLAVVGLWPHDDWLEAWFSVVPTDHKNLLRILHALRLTLLSQPYREPIRVLVSTPAGRAIAALLGFRLLAAGDDMEVWECHRSSAEAATRPRSAPKSAPRKRPI